MGSLGMFFYVVECFSVNLENLAADTVGSAQFRRINEQIESDWRFVAIALGETAHKVDEIGALDAKRTQVGDGLPKLSGLVFNSLLKVSQGVGGLFGWRGCDAAAKNVQLDFDAEEGLENSVVEIARDAAALRFNCAGA